MRVRNVRTATRSDSARLQYLHTKLILYLFPIYVHKYVGFILLVESTKHTLIVVRLYPMELLLCKIFISKITIDT